MMSYAEQVLILETLKLIMKITLRTMKKSENRANSLEYDIEADTDINKKGNRVINDQNNHINWYKVLKLIRTARLYIRGK